MNDIVTRADGSQMIIREPADLDEATLQLISEADKNDEGAQLAVLIAMSRMPDAQPDGPGVSEETIQEAAHHVMVISALELLLRQGLLEADRPFSFDPAIETMVMQTELGRQTARKLIDEHGIL